MFSPDLISAGSLLSAGGFSACAGLWVMCNNTFTMSHMSFIKVNSLHCQVKPSWQQVLFLSATIFAFGTVNTNGNSMTDPCPESISLKLGYFYLILTANPCLIYVTILYGVNDDCFISVLLFSFTADVSAHRCCCNIEVAVLPVQKQLKRGLMKSLLFYLTFHCCS